MLKWLNVKSCPPPTVPFIYIYIYKKLNRTLYLEIGPSSQRNTVIAYNYSLKYIHRGARVKETQHGFP